MTNLCSEMFTCARCGVSYHKVPGWDPMAEAVERFGVKPPNGVSVCDECDRAIRVWFETPEGQKAFADWVAAGRP